MTLKPDNREVCGEQVLPLKWAGIALIFLIHAYRMVISPLFPLTCRFYPSCSRYMECAVRRYGILKGGYLGIRRILRCHPYHPGGYDPVP